MLLFLAEEVAAVVGSRGSGSSGEKQNRTALSQRAEVDRTSKECLSCNVLPRQRGTGGHGEQEGRGSRRVGNRRVGEQEGRIQEGEGR